MFRNYLRRGVLVASAASTYYFVQQDNSPFKYLVKPKMVFRNREAAADDGQPAESDMINTILKKEFAPYTQEQIAKLNYTDAAKFRFELKSRQDHIKKLKSGE
jgi:hypothetical protein